MKRALCIIMLAMTLPLTSLALNPSKKYKFTPKDFNLTYQEFNVSTEDRATLKAWYFPTKNPSKLNRLVLILHNGEGNMGDYLERVNQLVNYTSVVTFDYRGFGGSSEFEIDNVMFIYPQFQSDVKAMINFCRNQLNQQTFNLYGWGIGAGLAIGIGYHNPEITRIVADTPFLSMEDLEERFYTWSEPMEVPFAGYEKRHEPIYTLDNQPNKNLQKVKLIIGSNDKLLKVDDMKKLQQKNPVVDQELSVIDNLSQIDNFDVDRKAYMHLLLSTFELE